MSDDRRAGRERTGPTIEEIVVGDAPEVWERAGFEVAPDGTVRVGAVRLRLTGTPGAPGRGIESWSLRGTRLPADDEIDGLPTSAATHTEPGGVLPRSSHPNGATRVDHVVVTTPDLGRTTAAFERRGFDVRRVSDAHAGDRPVRQVFFRAGEVLVEVVGPPGLPDDAAARPARFWGLAFRSADLDATKALLGDALEAPKDAVQPGRRIATWRLGAEGPSVAVAFMSPRA